jgi:hypothetical protein
MNPMKTDQIENDTTRSPGGHLQRLVMAIWKAVFGCSEPGCSERAHVFGVCKEHFRQEWIRAQMEVEREAGAEMKSTIMEALREMQAETHRGHNEPVLAARQETADTEDQ